MRPEKKSLLLACCFVFACMLSCKKWNDRTAVTDPALNETLASYISRQSNLSTFNSYLVKTGLDKMLGASKNYTVWAPANDALASLDPGVVNDTAKLKAFLLNHISGQQFFTRMVTDSMRVPLLNGKRVYFSKKHFDEANITQADVYVRNGVLHVTDKGIAPLPSIWEYIQGNTAAYSQNAYISSLVYQVQDPALAVLDSINPATGLPVYKPNTGIVPINAFRTRVYDIGNEDSLYTYVVMNNTAYATEVNREKPYFASNDANIATANASWNTVKDLAIAGVYRPDQLPAAFLSRFGVHIPISTSTIVETRRASNGIIYIVNDATPALAEKIPTVIVQGETPVGFKSNEGKYTIKIFYRQRNNPLTGQSFNDIYMNLGSLGPGYFADYISNDLLTVKYKIYWVALSDKTNSTNSGDGVYGTDSTFQQMLQIGPDSPKVFMPTLFNVTTKVLPYKYDEIYLGEFTNDKYDWPLSFPMSTPDGQVHTRNPATRRLRLQAPAAATTGIPFNLTLDYVKFVPVL